MSMRYLLLDGVFLIPPLLVVLRTPPDLRRRMVRLMVVLVVLTAVFDNLIIAANIVAYNPATTLGFTIGLAPLEDFAYALSAAVVLPYIWERVMSHG
jgi:lycopene cyclase domain-containing protein